jgi:hypothetical protein
MAQAEINHAVESCLVRAANSKRPFQQLAEFLLVLKYTDWPLDSIIEVQNRVIEGLPKRPDQ